MFIKTYQGKNKLIKEKVSIKWTACVVSRCVNNHLRAPCTGSTYCLVLPMKGATKGSNANMMSLTQA